MKSVLVLGAGKSSHHLIQYLVAYAQKSTIELTVADIDISKLEIEYKDAQNVFFNPILANNYDSIERLIIDKTIVISMLPATMHIHVARLCLKHSCHLLTPSYISDEMKSLDAEARAKNLLFFNELGFDPGIDHMTTMKLYHEIESNGGHLYSYKSYAGGLVAQKSDNNPWNYKFSWNPRNVILAGQGGTIKYKESTVEKYIPYYTLFKKAETIALQDSTEFDAYANRDSLKYEEIYGWENVKTLLRGTLRRKGFCHAWSVLVELGLTDDSFILKNTKGLSYFDFYSHFYSFGSIASAKEDLAQYLNVSKESELMNKLDAIGFFNQNEFIELEEGSPAVILQSILEKKWKLEDTDTDWVIMVHFLEYTKDNKSYKIESSLSLEGHDNIFTAMSRTVGMPIAYACELILEGKINEVGVHLPILPQLYLPILEKLEKEGIHFNETITEIN